MTNPFFIGFSKQKIWRTFEKNISSRFRSLEYKLPEVGADMNIQDLDSLDWIEWL